jgi:hypothetical protein
MGVVPVVLEKGYVVAKWMELQVYSSKCVDWL